jgi:DNA-binding NtrC family response regulator
VEGGRFLDELYYRLVGVSMTILPLRTRRDEIIPLAQEIVQSSAQAIDRSVELTEDACDWLYEQPWPGNFRELRTVCERAVLLAMGSRIDRAQISRVPLVGESPSAPVAAVAPARGTPLPSQLRASLADLERQEIMSALERCGGNQRRAAEILGIARRTLSNRLDQYEIARPRKRAQ